MIDTIYIEDAVQQHPRSLNILQRFPNARIIHCQRYQEVFNPKSQNFRLQKLKPALILAEKYNNQVLATPKGYGIGAVHNYYFSHMLNCLYDCRYCFLQGMYQSANYVLYVNYEDYENSILTLSEQHNGQMVHFFSGYDCDSIALEPVTGFVEHFLPFFSKLDNAWLELRTKSTQIRSLLEFPSFPRCVVAFSLSPQSIIESLEQKTPNLDRRIEAMKKLADQGWPIGLRFDPLIYQEDYQVHYLRLFEQVFSEIQAESIHSVSLGVFRLPTAYYKKIHQLYPENPLFSGPLKTQQNLTSYPQQLEQNMLDYCREQILRFIPPKKFFPCLQ